MKNALLLAILSMSLPGLAFAFGGTGVSEGPAIMMPSLDSLAAFADQNLPNECRPVDKSQINEVGPIGQNFMNGFIYSLSTDCDGVRSDFRIETSGGLAPQPVRLVFVR